MFDLVQSFEFALTVLFWVTNLASGAAHEEIWLVAMAHKTGAHHQRGKVANREGVGRRIGAPIEFFGGRARDTHRRICRGGTGGP